jgi:hypothetical protein
MLNQFNKIQLIMEFYIFTSELLAGDERHR